MQPPVRPTADPAKAEAEHGEASSLRFASAARTLGQVARARGLAVPGFRSPPRLDGVERSVRRRPDGGATIAVRLRGRPWVAVLGDMIEGVVVANRLTGSAAHQARNALWSGVEPHELRAA
jgi:hypothetical protein